MSTKSKQNKPVSEVARKAYDMLNKTPVPELEMSDMAAKTLHFYMKHVAGFKNYKIHILYGKDPKEVVLEVFNEEWKPVYIKLKDKTVLDKIQHMMQVSHKIRFATRKDYDDGEISKV